jgi:UPF0755 protein
MFLRSPTSKTVVVSLVRAYLLLLLGWYFLCTLVPPGHGTVVRDVSFPQGSGIRRLADELKSAGIVRSSWHLILIARLRGKANSLKAGEYRFSDAMTPGEILRKLVTGDVDYRRFVLPEGYSMFQAADLLEQKGYFKRDAFLAACRDPELLQRLGIAAPSVEGYLFPATYNLARTTTEAQLIAQMVGQFRKVYDEIEHAGSTTSTLTRAEVLTLASIIEKEAVVPQEKPLISSVFHNRLRLGMPLQSDPTSVYGVRTFAGKVSRADILRRSSHNTYLFTGLPPGPIGNPGAGAIRAALFPARTDYLYFVARKDGTHQFSRSLIEHNRAVARYLRR